MTIKLIGYSFEMYVTFNSIPKFHSNKTAKYLQHCGYTCRLLLLRRNSPIKREASHNFGASVIPAICRKVGDISVATSSLT